MIMMYFLFLISLVVCRFFAGYDSRFQNNRYIIIKNPKLRKLLLDETSFFERRKRLKKDINKMTVSGLVFYIFSFATFVVSTLLYFILPKTPIESWEFDTNNFFMFVDTLNEKLAAICIWLFFLILLLCVAIYMIKYAKSIKQKGIKIFTYTVSCIMIIAVMFVVFDIAREFIIVFL